MTPEHVGARSAFADPLSQDEVDAILHDTWDKEANDNPRFSGWLRVSKIKRARGAVRVRRPSYRASRAGRWK